MAVLLVGALVAAAASAPGVAGFAPLSTPGSRSTLGVGRPGAGRRRLPPAQFAGPAEEEGASGVTTYDKGTGKFYDSAVQQMRAGSSERTEYVATDASGNTVVLTKEEKETIFLDALNSFYYDGRELLGNDEFDLLKEDLLWEGSSVVTLSRQETLFLNAVQGYLKGGPIMDDKEFDALKLTLSKAGSRIATNTEPKCYLDTGVCTVTFVEDTFRQAVLYAPAALVGTLLWSVFSFEVLTFLRDVSPVVGVTLGSPVIYVFANLVTNNLIFKDPIIAKGPCPNCGAETRVFFGDALGIEGISEAGSVPCASCKTKLVVTRSTLRVKTLPKAQ